MTEADKQKVLSDLARAKAAFQQRAILAHLGEGPVKTEKPEEEG